MCFSAEASFGSGVILSIAGAIALNKTRTKSQIPFAAIPLLFSVQQFAEGFVWTAFRSNDVASWIIPSSYIFLVFALIIWPVWIPLSVWLLEKNPIRKKILFYSLMVGTFFALVLLFYLTRYPVDVSTDYYHIKYTFHSPFDFPLISKFLYLTSTVFSLLSSGTKNIRWLGAIILASYTLSILFFYENVVSVWCFMAAIASILIIAIIHNLNKENPGRTIIH